MKNQELEKRISEIFDHTIEARNAANNAIKAVQDLRQWLTAEDIKEMEAKLKAKK